MSSTQNLIEEARAAASGLSRLLDRLSDAFATEESIRNCPGRQALTSALHASFKAGSLAEALDEIETAIEPWVERSPR